MKDKPVEVGEKKTLKDRVMDRMIDVEAGGTDEQQSEGLAG